MLDGIILLWYVLTLLSLIYITFDLIYTTPEASVMKVGWWLVTLYAGPIALFFYLLSCKEPMPGTHEQFIAPLWKQSLGSMVHCLAGDATGIIIAAFFLTFFSIGAAWEIFIEYLAGFAFGWFIFQSLFMKGMMGGTYGKALTSSFIPEWFSMNMIMAGMIPVMAIWDVYQPAARDTLTFYFWSKMSLATLVAGLCAFPINRWLVKVKLKHGMMTIREGEMSMGEEHEHHQNHGPMVTAKEITFKGFLTLVGLAAGIVIAILGTTFKI
ncbi:MAG: DUF4396 domain-containing protein [Chlamydiia bacterium]|nr:DUF4396 domain-containing protein [Chlamydiia bacterium]